MATKDPVKDIVKLAAKAEAKEEVKAEAYADVVEEFAKTMEDLVAEAKYQYDHGCFGVLQQADFFAAVAKLEEGV